MQRNANPSYLRGNYIIILEKIHILFCFAADFLARRWMILDKMDEKSMI